MHTNRHLIKRNSTCYLSFTRICHQLRSFVRHRGCVIIYYFFFSSRRRHTRYIGDWSSDVCSSDLARKHAEELGHLGAAWEAIRKDPWGSVALGLTVAAGVGLMFVPGGQAIGAGILIGVALSGGVGIATGTFNPRMVAFNGVSGGITGGAGIATQVAVGAGIGGGGSIAQQEAFTGRVDWGQVALSAGVGGVGAGAGSMLSKLAAARSVNAATETSRAVESGGTVQLFRHVDPSELADIRNTGLFRLSPNSTGKYFAESAEHAQQWGQMLNNGEGAVVHTSVPTSVADQLFRWEKLDGIGPARFVSPEQLHWFNQSINGIREVP